MHNRRMAHIPVALFHETERNKSNKTERNRAIIVVKCVTKMYHIAI